MHYPRGEGSDAGIRSTRRDITMDTWQYRDSSWTQGSDLGGYDVEATDGSIGKVDDATDDISASYIVVDVGFWIFGKKRLIPAGAVSGVDHESKSVMVAMTKDQIKNAPDYDSDTWDEESRSAHEGYYSPYR